MIESTDTEVLTPQQRRTRAAIVAAAGSLLAPGAAPSVTAIARAAEVSRRTVYLYFPSLEHLLADAALGEMVKTQIDLGPVAAAEDPADRVEALIRAVQEHALDTEHLGRTLMRVATGPLPGGTPARGYRRVAWIELALEPARERLSPMRFERLVSALTTLVGWEPALVLRDVRGLDTTSAVDVTVWAARALVRAALANPDGVTPAP